MNSTPIDLLLHRYCLKLAWERFKRFLTFLKTDTLKQISLSKEMNSTLIDLLLHFKKESTNCPGKGLKFDRCLKYSQSSSKTLILFDRYIETPKISFELLKVLKGRVFSCRAMFWSQGNLSGHNASDCCG